ncbi:MAG: hypothetical protein ACK5OB_16855 [Pirellula sp.]
MSYRNDYPVDASQSEPIHIPSNTLPIRPVKAGTAKAADGFARVFR